MLHLNSNIPGNRDSASSTSSHDGNNSNSTLKEYLKNFSVDFGAVMDIPKGRDLFEQYLKITMNGEAMDFVKAVENYHLLKSSTNRYKEATNIVNDFLKTQAKYEINIPDDLLKATLDWFNKSSPSSCASNLFDKCFDIVLLQLKLDPFQRFLETYSFVEFVRSQIHLHGKGILQKLGTRLIRKSSTNSEQSQGEIYEDTISITTAELLGEEMQNDELPIFCDVDTHQKELFMTKYQYFCKRENPLHEIHASRDDFEFIQFMATDEPNLKFFFKQVVNTEGHQSFISRKPILMGKKQGTLFRLQFEYPVDYKLMAQIYHSRKFVLLTDPNVYHSRFLGKFPADKDEAKLAGYSVFGKIRMPLPFNDRYFVMSNCVVQDSSKEQILSISKSCKWIDSETGQQIPPVEEIKKLTLMYAYGGFLFQPIKNLNDGGGSRCRVIEICAVNLNSVISSELLAKIVAKRVFLKHKKVMQALQTEVWLNTTEQDEAYPITETISANEGIL